MKYLLSILFLACFSIIHAQDKNEIDTLTEVASNKYHLYIAPTYTANQFVETVASFAGFSAGLVYQNRIEANIYFNALLNDFKKRIIFPTDFVYGQMNVGLRIQYQFTDNTIRPIVGGGVQYAQLSWEAEGDLDDVYVDHMFIYDAYFGGEWMVSKMMSVQADIGYCFPGELQLIGLERQDLQGIKFDLTIKINVFSF